MATEIELPGIGEPETLRIRTRELPEPDAGEALVRVEASGVSFAEQQMRLGKVLRPAQVPVRPRIRPRRGGRAARRRFRTRGRAARHRCRAARGRPDQDRRVVRPRSTRAPPTGARPRGRGRGRRRDGGRERHHGLAHAAPHGSGEGRADDRRLGCRRRCRHDAAPTRTARRDSGDRDRRSAPAGPRARARRHPGRPPGRGRARPRARARSGRRRSRLRSRRRPRHRRLVAHAGSRGRARLLRHGVDQGPPGNTRLPVLLLILRLAVWNLLPNGRRTSFFNLWAGRRRPDRYWAEVRDDLGRVLDLLARGEISAQVAARFPLSEAAAALSYAEAGGGKVIIVPDAERPPSTAT